MTRIRDPDRPEGSHPAPARGDAPGKDYEAVLAAAHTELADIQDHGGTPNRLSTLADLIRAASDLVAADDQTRPPGGPATGSPDPQPGGPAAGSPDRQPDGPAAGSPELQPARLAGYLTSRVGAPVTVHRARPVVGGLSKVTIKVWASAGSSPLDVVIRQVPPGRPADGLVVEYAVLEWAWRAGVPVAEPLWIEPDPAVLGGPFIVSRMARGRNLGDVWGAVGTVDPRWCLQLADIMAGLHRVPVNGLVRGPAPPMRDPEEIVAAIDGQEARLLAAAHDPSDGRRLFAWLRAAVPAPSGPIVVVHGDVGFHNSLADDDGITALLDWERAHLGSPVEDLEYVRPTVEPILAWDAFLARYAEAGGPPLDADATRFYRVWQEVWRYVACVVLAADFRASGRYSSAVAGYVNGPRFLRAAVAAVTVSPPAPHRARRTSC